MLTTCTVDTVYCLFGIHQSRANLANHQPTIIDHTAVMPSKTLIE
jgi:hypothetical protein